MIDNFEDGSLKLKLTTIVTFQSITSMGDERRKITKIGICLLSVFLDDLKIKL